MKISCDIIRDILPLYAENMVSNATKEMVDGHLSECEACTQELAEMKKPEKVPAEVETGALKRLGDSIRRRRILAVMAAFLFIVTVILGGALMLDATVYLSAGQAVKEICVEAEGVKILWDDRIIGTSAVVQTDDPRNYSVTAWTNLHRLLFPSERVSYDQLSEEMQALISEEQYEAFDNSSFYTLEAPDATNFIYTDPGSLSMTLLLNAGQPLPEEPIMEVNQNCAYYAVAMAALSALCILAGMLYRGRWYGELTLRLGVVLGSLAVSCVVVTAGQLRGLDGAFQEMLTDSSVVAVPMALFGLCVLQLVKLNRRDRGM